MDHSLKIQLFTGRACGGSATEVIVASEIADQTNDMPGGPWKAVDLNTWLQLQASLVLYGQCL